MIKFCCKNCGQKISVPEIHAGKKGRCPKCKNIVIIPKYKTTEPEVPIARATDDKTKPEKSPLDSAVFDVPPPEQISQTIEDKKHHEDIHTMYDGIAGTASYESKEQATERRLPWSVDAFLYPISASGLVNLAILSFLPRMLPPLGHLNYWMHPSPSLAIIVILVGYLIYCLSDYIRDSTGGNRRAPDIELSLSILLNAWELIWLILRTFICITVCDGPLLAYLIITKQTDTIFWLLVTYGVLFLPMVLMAVVLFDSLRALNPILIMASMLKVFLPYCGLVLLFFSVCGLIAIILVIMPQSWLISYLLSAVCIYLTIVMSHLLGRFCYQYKERLNWEV